MRYVTCFEAHRNEQFSMNDLRVVRLAFHTDEQLSVKSDPSVYKPQTEASARQCTPCDD